MATEKDIQTWIELIYNRQNDLEVEPFELLSYVDVELWRNLISHCSIKLIACLLLHLEPTRATALIQILNPIQQKDVIKYINQIFTLPNEVIFKIEHAFEVSLSSFEVAETELKKLDSQIDWEKIFPNNE